MIDASRIRRPRRGFLAAGLWLSAIAAAAVAKPAPVAQESLPPEALKALEQALEGFDAADLSIAPMSVGPDGRLLGPDGKAFDMGALGNLGDEALGGLFGRLVEAQGEAAELGDDGLGLRGTPPPDALLATPSLAALARADKLELFQLRTGQLLWATLDEHDEDRVYLTRLDNGGYLELPWGLLDPRQDRELRMRFGYIDLGVEEFTILADRIPLNDGTELVGLVTARTSDALHVKTANSFIVLPLGRVGGAPTAVRVPARDIYTREELYEQKLAELRGDLEVGGATSAQALWDLAQYCERIFDYGHAVEAYGQMVEVDPTFVPADQSPAALASVLERAQRRAESQAQVDYLEEADRMGARGQFEKAFEMLGRFPDLYPDSPLVEDWVKINQRVIADRDRVLVSLASREWFQAIDAVARKAARDMTYEETVDWIEDGMGDEIVALVSLELQKVAPEIESDAARELFERRSKSRVRKASYGTGTWLLGKERATAGLVEESETPELSGRDAERQELEDQIQRYLRNQNVSGRSGGPTEEQDPGEFWDTLTSGTKRQWILSYYAEFGGDLELKGVSFLAHRDCGGTGFIEVVQTGPPRSGAEGARTQLKVDPLCNGIGGTRRVTYR